MGGCPEFHVLKYASDNILYHPGSGALFKVSSTDAQAAKLEESARDAGARDGSEEPGDSDYQNLQRRLLARIEGAATEHQSGAAQPACLLPIGLSKLVLLVSHACNMRCTYCFARDANTASEYMTLDIARHAVDTFLSRYAGRLNSVFFFGGEPLLNWDMVRDVVEYTTCTCERRGVSPPRFAIQTNGTLIDRAKATYLKENRFLVTVSLDGPVCVNDAQRRFIGGGGSYSSVIRGITHLAEQGVQFNMEATISRLHFRLGVSIRDVLDHLLQLGAYRVHIMPVTGTCSRLRLNPIEASQAAEEFAAVAAACVASLATDEPKRLQYVSYVIENLVLGAQPYICYAGTGTATVDTDGSIYPCYLLGQPNCLMGNVGDLAPWGQYERVQACLLAHDRSRILPCDRCWAHSLCNSCYGAEPSAMKTLSPPVADLCSIQRAIIDATLGKLSELSRVPEQWNRLVLNLATEFGRDGRAA